MLGIEEVKELDAQLANLWVKTKTLEELTALPMNVVDLFSELEHLAFQIYVGPSKSAVRRLHWEGDLIDTLAHMSTTFTYGCHFRGWLVTSTGTMDDTPLTKPI